jgi:ribonuclease HI
MLRRYEKAAAQAVMEGPKGVRKIGPDLCEYATDLRILREAWNFLKMHGGAAPGPNGRTYTDYGNHEVWEMLRAYSESIRKGTYRPGPDRIVPISKGGNRGTRTLRLQDIHDRVVARAIVEIIQPLLDPGFDPYSFGFRPGLDRLHALATAMHLAETQDRMFFVLEDIKNAFDQVPVQRLLDIVRKKLPNAEDLWQLIEIVVGNGTKRGIRQGSPLSPISLNLYLDHVLDRPWRKRHPDAPLLRSADDILVPCRTEKEALDAQHHLRRILTPAGMPLKDSTRPVRDLHKGETADWLGYRIFRGKDGLKARISVDAWSTLAERLLQAHDKPASPLRAGQIVEGWIDQLGPCLPHEDVTKITARIAEIGRQAAFEELPDAEDLMERWREAYSRWRKIRQAVSAPGASTTLLPANTAGKGNGSADCHDFCAESIRSDGPPMTGGPSLFLSPGEQVLLFTDGACLPFSHVGGWAFLLKPANSGKQVGRRGGITRTTNNRAELLAVIRGLESLGQPARVCVVTDSQYVNRGINEFLPIWKAQGWRAGTKKHRRDLKNIDLWQRLDALVQVHEEVICRWVPGHSGHAENEACDRQAELAARQLEQRLGAR